MSIRPQRVLAGILTVLLFGLLTTPTLAGDRELSGRLRGREVFRLCIFFSHPPFPGTVIMTTPSGERLCQTDINFTSGGASFGCTLPGNRALFMTIRQRLSDRRVVWTATVDGEMFQGFLTSPPPAG